MAEGGGGGGGSSRALDHVSAQRAFFLTPFVTKTLFLHFRDDDAVAGVSWALMTPEGGMNSRFPPHQIT